jgi:hypothetical protein
MKTYLKITPLALAVAAAFALSATSALAGRDDDNRNDGKDPHGSSTRVNTDISINKDIDVDGKVYIYGHIDPKADAEAVIQGDQLATQNKVVNKYHQNNASVNDNSLNNAQGNVGVNMSAGDNNIQSNELAIAAQDATNVFGMATAQVMFDQGSFGNVAINKPANNNASISNNVLNGAQGNVGVNVSAGDGNVQRNAAALSSGHNNVAIATVSTEQKNAGNFTLNKGEVLSWGTAAKTSGTVTQQTASLDASFNASFNADGSFSKSGGSYHSSTNTTSSDDQNTLNVTATTTGTGSVASASKSVNDPMSVSVTVSNGGSATATATSDVNSSLKTTDDRSSSWGKNKQFSKSFTASGAVQAASNEILGCVTTQYVPVPQNILWSTNNANLSNNVLNGASGNVGVNIAAGTNNLQENIMAAAATSK